MARSRVPRLGVLWCPHWPVVVAGAAEGEQVAVLHANRVVAHSLAAAVEGVSVGMRRRETQARCPHVRLVPHEPDRDLRAFEGVVRAIGEDVPRLEVTEPGLLMFHARGPARYFGGEAAMAGRLAAVAAQAAGVSMAAVGPFGMGIADGRFAATVAARRAAAMGAPVLVPSGPQPTRDFLAPLPVHLLAEVAGAPPEFVHLLHRLGLHHLGALADLDEADLGARFGPLGTFAHRLATGGDDRLPGVQDPPTGLHVQRVFEEPVHHSDVLVFVARQLAEELTTTLRADGQVCTRLVVQAETEHGERSERVWSRSTGLAAAAMVERVRWQLDGWARDDTLTAGVVLLRLLPDEVRGDDGEQQGLWGGRTQADDWAMRAVARLVAVAGEQQVLVPAAQGGRHPRDAYRWVPAVTVELADPSGRLAAPAVPWPGRLPSPSPAVVHPEPVPVEVVDAEGRPVTVSGRGVVSAAPAVLRDSRGAQAVDAWAGPWPVEERWWDAARSRRMARFQVQTGDGRLVLLAVERGGWWLLAEYA
ncbi:MAG: DNA polymerase Y family protein [Acidimicrobiaceae bacterium]|nr:DNA polymerase Y family protein [Acidimicrobiaceae bacterium]